MHHIEIHLPQNTFHCSPPSIHHLTILMMELQNQKQGIPTLNENLDNDLRKCKTVICTNDNKQMLPSKTLVASQQAEHQPLKQVQGSRLEEWIQKN